MRALLINPEDTTKYLRDFDVEEGKNRKGGTGYLMSEEKRRKNRKKRK